MNGETMAGEGYYGEGPEDGRRADDFGHVLAVQRQRIDGSEAALAASTVVNELSTTFPEVTENPVVKAALPLAPLLLLQPARRGFADPRLLAGAALVGVAIASELKNRSQPGQPKSVKIMRSAAAPLVENDKDLFAADALDGSGHAVRAQNITWASDDEKVATIDANTGLVQAVKEGFAKITATLTVDGTPQSDSVGVLVRKKG